jgi:16S rRNA processing protein RimM
MTDSPDRLVAFARALGAHGVAGEVRVEPFDAAHALFLQAPVFYALSYPPKPNEVPRPLKVAGVRGTTARAIARFDGIDSREKAQAVKATLLAERAFLPAASQDFYLTDDLVGLQARNRRAAQLGTVTGTAFNGAQDMLEIEDGRGHRFFVPIVAQYVEAIDFASGVVTLDWEPDWL